MCTIVKLLILNGVSPKCLSKAKRQTPVHLAAMTGCTTCLKVMYDFNQPSVRSIIEARDFENKTALHAAILEKGDTGNAVEMLLNFGADPQSEWVGLYRPVHLAAQRGDNHILAAVLLSLIEKTLNFQLNVETKDGFDPLDLAIEGNHVEAAAMLT